MKRSWLLIVCFSCARKGPIPALPLISPASVEYRKQPRHKPCPIWTGPELNRATTRAIVARSPFFSNTKNIVDVFFASSNVKINRRSRLIKDTDVYVSADLPHLYLVSQVESKTYCLSMGKQDRKFILEYMYSDIR